MIDARTLHGWLGVKWQFNQWMRTRVADYGFEAEIDFWCFSTKTGGRPRTHYLLTIDTAKELAMIERTPKGRANSKVNLTAPRHSDRRTVFWGSNTLSCTKGFKLCRSRKHLPRSRRGSSIATPVPNPSPASPSQSTAPRWTVAATYAATVPAAPAPTWNAGHGAWLRRGNVYVARSRFN